VLRAVARNRARFFREGLQLRKKKVSPVLRGGWGTGLLYWAMYGQTVTSFGKTVLLCCMCCASL
jgi:hypothetical protein